MWYLTHFFWRRCEGNSPFIFCTEINKVEFLGFTIILCSFLFIHPSSVIIRPRRTTSATSTQVTSTTVGKTLLQTQVNNYYFTTYVVYDFLIRTNKCEKLYQLNIWLLYVWLWCKNGWDLRVGQGTETMTITFKLALLIIMNVKEFTPALPKLDIKKLFSCPLDFISNVTSTATACELHKHLHLFI